MEAMYINSFITSVVNCIETMTGVAPDRQPPYIKEDLAHNGDITGMIGFEGENISGSVALSFPQATALMVYQIMTGAEVFQITEAVQDSIGKLANTVAGGAKTQLSEENLSFHISIPTILVGKNHLIRHKVDTPVMAIPFNFKQFDFSMEVAMNITKSE